MNLEKCARSSVSNGLLGCVEPGMRPRLLVGKRHSDRYNLTRLLPIVGHELEFIASDNNEE
jgi:hypothetical protein